ncbi:MAG: hypothetical protein MZU84_06805 [Sphingobacterium sp.]|nr:hypothetical protein [Sphingobacterium sp.]
MRLNDSKVICKPSKVSSGGMAVPGIACVSAMKISGVVVGGSTRMGVVSMVGASGLGVMSIVTPQASEATANRERNSRAFFMVNFLSCPTIPLRNEKLPRRWGSLDCPHGQ